MGGRHRRRRVRAVPRAAGSDCSRCDNDGRPSFAPFCEAGGSSTCAGGCEGEAAASAARRVPVDLPPGDYVLEDGSGARGDGASGNLAAPTLLREPRGKRVAC